MPAALREGPRATARPKSKAPGNASRPRGPTRAATPTAGKFGSVQGVGLSPQHALAAAGGLMVLALVLALATGDRAQKISDGVSAGVDRTFAAMGFKLRAVHVQGASPMAAADILAAAGLYKDQPLIGLNLDQVRERVERVGWVRDVRVVRMLPDTVVIAVVERGVLAVWQHDGRAQVIDAQGHVIAEADPGRFPNLPLIVGQGAADYAPQILPAVASRPRLMERVEALVRVDGRRWDLRLKDGSLVQLPAVDEEAALIQLEQLDQSSRILELGFERIDLRDPSVVAVRPRDGALPGQLVAGGA